MTNVRFLSTFGREPAASDRTVRWSLALCAVLACYLLFFHRLAERDLWSSHEARAAMDAQSVLEGDWALPHLLDGRAELQKPPLYYWLVALIARLRGGTVDALAVRLPAALSALGTVWLLVWFGRRIGRPRIGVLAAAILATAVHFPWLARIGRIDMPLTFAVSVACAAFYLSARAETKRLRFSLIGYLAIAAAVLLKGPIGAVLPVAVLLVHRVLSVRTPHSALRTPHSLWWGVPLVLALTLPWYLWANIVTDGEFFRTFIWYHNIERGLGGSSLRSHAWWLYLPYFANDFLPWTPILFVVGIVAWRRDWLRIDPEARFGVIWLATVVLVLSCASFKRADYLLPAYPGAALLLACLLTRCLDCWDWTLLSWQGRTGHKPEAQAKEAPPPSLALRACLGTNLLGEAMKSQSILRFAVGSLALAVVAGWLVRVEIGLPAEEPFRDYRRFAEQIRTRAPAPESIQFFRTEAHALAFHVGRPLRILVEWQELQTWLSLHGHGFIVMAPDSAAVWRHHLQGVQLHEVLRNTELSGGRHERPLVLVRAEREAVPCPTFPNYPPSPTSP